MRAGIGKRIKELLLVALCCVSCAPSPTPIKPPKPERWVVYYGNTEPPEAFMDYDVVLFDRRYHPPIGPLLEDKERILLAYVSAGEVHGFRHDEIAQLKKEGALLKANKDWGSHIVDLTSDSWRRIVMREVADALNQGFHGVMLDTIDTPLQASAERSPEAARANHEAAVQLIHDIRAAYPDIKIMLNRGFPLLPEVSKQLDFILAESILSETNVSTGHSQLFPHMTYREMTTMLRNARLRSHTLKIYTLDYWKTDDEAGIRQLYAIHREQGFVPYVTTPDLRTLSPEPHSKPKNHRDDGYPSPVRKNVREDNDA